MRSMSQRPLKNYGVRSPDRQPFFICALPRSGTAWLANFLTWGDCFCFHEGLCGCESLAQLQARFDRARTPFVGCSDTALAHVLPAVYQHWPDAKYVFLSRDVDDVCASLERLKLPTAAIGDMLLPFWWGFSNIPNSMTIEYETLFSSATMKDVWAFLELEDPFPFERFQMLRDMRVEEGIYTGYGRFGDRRVININREKFGRLCQSINRDPAYEPVHVGLV